MTALAYFVPRKRLPLTKQPTLIPGEAAYLITFESNDDKVNRCHYFAWKIHRTAFTRRVSYDLLGSYYTPLEAENAIIKYDAGEDG